MIAQCSKRGIWKANVWLQSTEILITALSNIVSSNSWYGRIFKWSNAGKIALTDKMRLSGIFLTTFDSRSKLFLNYCEQICNIRLSFLKSRCCFARASLTYIGRSTAPLCASVQLALAFPMGMDHNSPCSTFVCSAYK